MQAAKCGMHHHHNRLTLLFCYPVLGFDQFYSYLNQFAILIADDTCQPGPLVDIPQGWSVAEEHRVLNRDKCAVPMLVLVRSQP